MTYIICTECKGSKIYQPLFGPPEDCQTCEGKGVFTIKVTWKDEPLDKPRTLLDTLRARAPADCPILIVSRGVYSIDRGYKGRFALPPGWTCEHGTLGDIIRAPVMAIAQEVFQRNPQLIEPDRFIQMMAGPVATGVRLEYDHNIGVGNCKNITDEFALTDLQIETLLSPAFETNFRVWRT